MFVVEHRRGTATRRHHTAYLLHEIFPREQMLLLFIPGVIPVLTDKKHAIHREFLSPHRQRLHNARVDRHAMRFGESPTQIILGILIHIHRRDIDARRDKPGICRKPFHIFRNNHISMRIRSVFGDNRGNAFSYGHEQDSD